MEIVLKEKIKEAVKIIYNSEVKDDLIQIQETRKDFKGDFTLVVFPLLRFSKNTPEKTGEMIGQFLTDNFPSVSGFNVIKGFLNHEKYNTLWVDYFRKLKEEKKVVFDSTGRRTASCRTENHQPLCDRTRALNVQMDRD